MNSIIIFIIIIVLAMLVTTSIYRFLPFRRLGAKKPIFTLFPKYTAQFDKPVSEIVSSLKKLEFKEIDHHSYARGKIYGDFSAKAIKLAVKIDEENSQIKVYAPFFGVLFDTGDLWQITTDILKG